MQISKEIQIPKQFLLKTQKDNRWSCMKCNRKYFFEVFFLENVRLIFVQNLNILCEQIVVINCMTVAFEFFRVVCLHAQIEVMNHIVISNCMSSLFFPFSLYSVIVPEIKLVKKKRK